MKSFSVLSQSYFFFVFVWRDKEGRKKLGLCTASHWGGGGVGGLSSVTGGCGCSHSEV